MIFKNVISICKRAKRITLLETRNGLQLAGDGSAYYPLYGIPKLDAETGYAVFDVPEGKRGDVQISVISASDWIDPEALEGTELTAVLTEELRIGLNGMTLYPIRGEGGLAFIDVRYLTPFRDLDDVTLWQGAGPNGRFIAVKSGISVVGVIMPVRVPMSGMAHDLMDLAYQAAEAAEDEPEQEYADV